MPAKDDLLIAVVNKIDGVLTGGDPIAPTPGDNYVSWCLPGIPFQPEDLQFAIKGISGKDGEETRRLVRNAAEFSRVVNLVPSSHTVGNDMQRDIFNHNGSVLWDVYSNVLKYSEVASSDLTEEQKAKIEKFRKLFEVSKKVKDIVTDEEKIVTEDGPMLKAYKQKMAAYIDATLEYNTRRLTALNAEDKLSVQDFTLNANSYKKKVSVALEDWVTNGYKEDVEKINAFIAQITLKDMTLLKANLLDKMDHGKLTDPNTNSEFYLSSFYPGNFMNSETGWTKFTFSEVSKNTYAKETHQSTSGAAGAGWGLWAIQADGAFSQDTSLQTMDSTGFSMSFSMVQVPIARPWFSPEFLLNKAWRWKENMGQKLLCDGCAPPVGQLIAYPTTAVFIKDLKLKGSTIHSFDETISKSLDVGVSVGWGPFSIRGRHKWSSKEVTSKYNQADQSLTVDGMQLIAFKCFPMPKAPDPVTTITNWK